jgi:hypothetical protein
MLRNERAIFLDHKVFLRCLQREKVTNLEIFMENDLWIQKIPQFIYNFFLQIMFNILSTKTLLKKYLQRRQERSFF